MLTWKSDADENVPIMLLPSQSTQAYTGTHTNMHTHTNMYTHTNMHTHTNMFAAECNLFIPLTMFLEKYIVKQSSC